MIENQEQLEQSKDWLRYMESSVEGWKHLIVNLKFPLPPSFNLDIEELEGFVTDLKAQIVEYEKAAEPTRIVMLEHDAAWEDDAPPDFLTGHDSDEDDR